MCACILATPAEVLIHYYCFLADSLNNEMFYQLMFSMNILKEADKTNFTMVVSEYQNNSYLLDDLIVSDANSISKFCHSLQDTETQQEIGQMLVNGMYMYVYIFICLNFIKHGK